MAEASVSVDQLSLDQFSCPVCLDLLKDPVAIPCGHSFCINGCLDQEDHKSIYSCPQCRNALTPRPVLYRNDMLAEVVEKLKEKTEVQDASPDHCYAGPGDVECDFCTGRKHKAFSCPVCLDLLKDPVAIPCGHSFCKVCINGCGDQEDQKSIYSCPQCRDTFTPRPVLYRNDMLAEVVEKLKEKTVVQDASPDHCYAGPGDVECDFCTGRKHKAVKSCLICVASFCEIHLKPHLEVSGLKKHTIVKASAKLQEKICSEHGKLIEIYCRTDQTCICYLCAVDNHKGHETITVGAERAEKQSQLKEVQTESQQRIQEKQKKVQELKQAVDTIKQSAQTAVDEVKRTFTELTSFLAKKRSEMIEMIRDQERAEHFLEQLEQEIADL
ncbi:E3 ubiquitin-protein ligase TRIM47-like [Silurus meridionalis]|uniref:E3 ubiquitin-protein ligase TRIM47-like n=1 Tax=Silurus meridionalis TaxID=175797 RepID=UPI001EEB452B|nr:E3 ubiquitin-protein ligase TRIM47-like [Silurus meridionalis]